ncbi:hypothetical protein CHUAL_009105 [Chamberlinius hualienensis]
MPFFEIMDSSCNDEAVKDQGAYNRHLTEYTDREIEGHRANTYEAGLLNGNGGHRRHHRRHRHHHKHHHHKGESGEDRPVTPPSQRVRFILGEGCEDDDLHPSHPVFSEMAELTTDSNGDLEWRETARWVKFEENVEEGGNRWSKPHVATLSLHSLFELRCTILNGTVMLDCDASTVEQLIDLILDNLKNNSNLSEVHRDKIKDIFLRRHRHQHEKRHDNIKGSKMTLIRSLADIGRVHSSSKSTSSSAGQQDLGLTASPSGTSLSRNHSGGHLGVHDGMTGSTSTSEMQLLKSNQHFMKKLSPGTEASNILVGEVDFLDHTISAFVRVSAASILGDLTEVSIPTRFVFFCIGPQGNIARYHEIGRALATLMSDEVFHEVAYKGKSRQDIIAAVDEFLDAVTVLPPGEWDPSIRIEPPQKIPSQEHRIIDPDQPKEEVDEEYEEERERAASGLRRTGRLFGGLMNDIKRRAPWYWSDFKDALALQCLASFVFLYFACLTPIITFGGLLGEATEDRIAAIESLVSGCVCGLLYGFFSGQPLNILSSTGPVLVFETISYSFCSENDLDYLSFRLWIGMWVGLILMILVAIDASAFVMYITRFTEENFACLISLIFIYNAFENMWDIAHEYPVNKNFDPAIGLPPRNCSCFAPENYTGIERNWTDIGQENCTSLNGTMVGPDCEHFNYPDVFFFSMLLFILTFLSSTGLKEIKNSSFFPAKVREVINDFAVTIAIVSMVFLDWYVGLDTPKLMVPSNFKPTWSGRGWIIHPFGKNPWWTSIAAIIPALLATILIFMDQQITAVIVNRKENKLKKGAGYHLDLFVLAILIIINSIMGLPWFVAGTVLAVNHVNSLRMESETAAPGEKPQFLGVREQRVTHLLIFILIGCSVLLTPVLQVIPMPVLYGVFLYMGASSLQGLQFIQRILIVFMPAKYQPDYMFLRQVPLKRVHLFTLIQLLCLVSLWLVKSYKTTSIAFPLMLVVLIAVRKLLDFVFTRRELKVLDDELPESTKRKREEEKRRKSQQFSEEGDECNGEQQNGGKGKLANNYLFVANGSLVKGSSEKFEKLNMSEEVAKSGIWKHVNDSSSEELTNHKNKNKNVSKRGSKKDVMNEEEYKRLSTMAEEEDEDGPISIRIESPSGNDLTQRKSTLKSKSSDKKDSIPGNHSETSV